MKNNQQIFQTHYSHISYKLIFLNTFAFEKRIRISTFKSVLTLCSLPSLLAHAKKGGRRKRKEKKRREKKKKSSGWKLKTKLPSLLPLLLRIFSKISRPPLRNVSEKKKKKKKERKINRSWGYLAISSNVLALCRCVCRVIRFRVTSFPV